MSKSQLPVPLDEQETVIQISRNGNTADIWTSDSTMIHKLEKYMSLSESPYKVKDEYKLEDGRRIILEVECPKKLVSLRSKLQAKREYTEEELKSLRERFAKVREAKKKEEE